MRSTGDIVAAPVTREFQLNPTKSAHEWRTATPVCFCSDWRGENCDLELLTAVRALWSVDQLYLRFDCRYRGLYMFPGRTGDGNGRRDCLWERDVVEVFLQPDRSQFYHYKEFEVAPNGLWIDLEVSSGSIRNLESSVRRSVSVDRESRVWSAELAIPMASLAPSFDSHEVWYVNFYRIEGRREPRAYLAWQPTNTPQPEFHVPSSFGKLHFGHHRESV